MLLLLVELGNTVLSQCELLTVRWTFNLAHNHAESDIRVGSEVLRKVVDVSILCLKFIKELLD